MFGFRIVIKDKPLTRRRTLSTMSSVYDPLGIASPFLLVGKRILQDLCRTKLGWDDESCEEFRVLWEKWRGQLPALEHFSMERRRKPCSISGSLRKAIYCSKTSCNSLNLNYHVSYLFTYLAQHSHSFKTKALFFYSSTKTNLL